MNIIQAFHATLSPDNNTRQQGEQVLNNLKTQPQNLPQVLQIGTNTGTNETQSTPIRKAALLCFTRTINQMDDISVIDINTLQTIIQYLLTLVKNENDTNLKGVVASSVSNFAELIQHTQTKWNDYFQNILNFLQDQRPLQQIIALEILSASMDFEGSDIIVNIHRQLLQYLNNVLLSNDSLLRRSGLDFLSTAIVFLETTPQHAAETKQLFPAIRTCVSNSLGGDGSDFEYVSMSLCELIENTEMMFVNSELSFAQEMFTLCSSSPKKEIQQSALEIVICLIEQVPKIFKSNAAFLGEVIKKCLDWIRTIDDDAVEMWLNDEEPVEVENWNYAQDALVRVVDAVGGSPIREALFSTSLQYLNSQEWRYRYSALTALSLCVAPGKFVFKHALTDLLQIIVSITSTANAIVLYAALELLEELTDAFPKICRRRHFVDIIKIIIASLSSQCATVQDKACYTLNALLNEDKKTAEQLTPFINPLMEGIFKTLQSNNIKAISSSLSIIVFTTRVVGQQMSPYYQALYQVVSTVFPNCNTEDKYEIKGKLIEIMCIYSLINNEFFPDSRNHLLSAFDLICNSTDVSNPMTPYLLSGICRFCEANDAAFKQMLPKIIQLIHQRLSLPEGDTPNTYEEISVTNPFTEEKVYMLHTLFRITTSLKAEYGTLVQQTINIIIPLMNHSNNDIRSVSCHLVPSLYEDYMLYFKASGASQEVVMNNTRPLYFNVVDHICMLLSKEKFTDNIQSLLTCLKMVLMLSGDNSLNEEKISAIFTTFDLILQRILEGVGLDDDNEVAQIDGIDTDVLDDEEYEKIQEAVEDEDDWLSLILDILTSICQTHTTIFLNPFQYKLFPRVMVYFNQTEDLDRTSFAVAVLGCVICDGKIYDYIPQIVEKFVYFSQSKNIDVANNAIYFLGQFAKNEIPQFVQYIPLVLDNISKSLNRKRTRAAVELADQVMLCVGNIVCHYYQQIQNAQQYLTNIIQMFPAQASFDEMIILLLALHQRNLLIPVVNDANAAENIFKLVSYFAKAIENDNAEEKTKNGIVQLIQVLTGAIPREMVNQIWARLTIEQRGDLDSLFHN
ncbi:Importin beta-3 subunit [Entamoeba marina]